MPKLTYLGPAQHLDLGGKSPVGPGDDCTVDDKTLAALVRAGHRFQDAKGNVVKGADLKIGSATVTAQQQAAQAAGQQGETVQK